MKIAIGSNETSSAIIHKDVTWQQIVKKYTTHKVTSKKGGEYVIGGEYSGSVRREEFMIGRSLLVVDIDSYQGGIDNLAFDLSMLPFGFVAYSSYSHTSANPRIRVIAQLSRMVTPDEYRIISRDICAQMLVPMSAIDECSFVPNQAMFAPQHPKGGEFWTMVQDGCAVCVPNSIMSPAVRESDDFCVMVASQPLDLSDIQVAAYLAAYNPIGLDYDSWLRVGMAVCHQYSGALTGFDMWVEWSKQDTEKFDLSVMSRKWKSFGGSSNPVTMASIIQHINLSGAVVSTSGTSGGWLEQIANCEDKHALEQLIQHEIARDKSIGTVDLADLESAVKLRFAEFGVVLRADPLRKLFKPKQMRAFPDIGGGETPLETMDNLRVVCDNNDIVIRYNMIKKDDEILIKDTQWSIDNSKNASITWLRSACHKVEMRTTNLKNFVTLLADGNQFNPVVEWVNSREWDGVSRLNDLYATITENKDLCSRELKETVVLRWMVGAIAAAFSPVGVMVRGVLVFQGEQYTGKTRWIEALAPKELDLIKTGRSLVVHDKDSVKQILSSWISELGELDATFKKSDIAALKAFITSDMDELRRPYAAAESQYARRTVFAASVNDSKFLQDDTGNSRFMVIPIIALNHAHTLDMQQVWAEIYVLWKSGEKHYLSADEMAALNSHNENFTATDPIFEMIASHLNWESFSQTTCKWMQVSDVLRWIGKDNPSRFESISAGKAIKKINGGIIRKSHGKQLVAVPDAKNDSLLSEFDKSNHGGNRFDYPEDHIPF
jgi:hypothetical protein